MCLTEGGECSTRGERGDDTCPSSRFRAQAKTAGSDVNKSSNGPYILKQRDGFATFIFLREFARVQGRAAVAAAAVKCAGKRSKQAPHCVNSTHTEVGLKRRLKCEKLVCFRTAEFSQSQKTST